MGVHWKIWFFRREGVRELKRGGVGQFAHLRSGVKGPGKKRRLVFFGGCFFLHFGRQSACHDITNSADSQINKSFSGNDCMTAEFYKNVYQANNFRLEILGNKRVLGKTQISWRQILVSSCPSRNTFSVIVVKIYTEADFKVS